MIDPNVSQAERDIRDGILSLEGIYGLVDTFKCYVITDDRYDETVRDKNAIFDWCEKTFGEHKASFLWIPSGIIEKEKNYWFLAEKKYRTLFEMKWKTLGGSR